MENRKQVAVYDRHEAAFGDRLSDALVTEEELQHGLHKSAGVYIEEVRERILTGDAAAPAPRPIPSWAQRGEPRPPRAPAKTRTSSEVELVEPSERTRQRPTRLNDYYTVFSARTETVPE